MTVKEFVSERRDSGFLFMTGYGYVGIEVEEVEKFLEGCSVSAITGYSDCSMEIRSEDIWDFPVMEESVMYLERHNQWFVITN